MAKTLLEYPPGLVLWIIINNKEFDSSLHREREGAEVDGINLIEALQPFQIDLRVWENYKRQEILNGLREIKEEVDREPNKFAGLVILGASHGVEHDGRDFLVASDCKPLLIETIIGLYHNEYCVGLNDCPKFYLFNMCRGTYRNVQIESESAIVASLADNGKKFDTSEVEENKECCGLHLSDDSFLLYEKEVNLLNHDRLGIEVHSSVSVKGAISFKRGDYMIVHSTIRGYISNRHKYLGTVFIQELTKSIKSQMSKQNHNFEEVIRSACFAASSHQSSGVSAPQVPEITTTLRAPFRFILKGNLG